MQGGDAVDDLCGLFLQTLSGLHLLRPLVTDHSSLKLGFHTARQSSQSATLALESRFHYMPWRLFPLTSPGLGSFPGHLRFF